VENHEKARRLEGARVVARGSLEPNVHRGRLQFRLDAKGLAAADPEREPDEAEKTLASVFRGYRRYRKTIRLPDAGGPLRVLCVHPRSGTAMQDFRRQISPGRLAHIHSAPASFSDPSDVRRAIRLSTDGAPPHLVALLRGGGDPGELDVLNDPSLLEAWRDLDAFTLCAIGHAKDGVLLDPLSDLSCETPTAAGTHLHNRLVETANAAAHGGTAETVARERAARLDAEASLRRQRLLVRLLVAAAAVLLLILVASGLPYDAQPPP
jgi:exonuclease VII large subunit